MPGVTPGVPPTPKGPIDAAPSELNCFLIAINAQESDTAILFFSHRPECEWRNKWMVRKDFAKNRAAAQILYRHTLEGARASGLPVLEVTDDRQRGADFGARLANAFADAFAQGYEHVIAVGSDCPRLHEVDWDAVAAQVAIGTPVVGPTSDQRGAYLIGLRRAQFRREAFAGLPWQSPDLLTALVRHLTHCSQAAPALLPPRRDVNGPQELQSLIRTAAPDLQGLADRLGRVLGSGGRERSISSTVTRHFSRSVRLRAPPSQ